MAFVCWPSIVQLYPFFLFSFFLFHHLNARETDWLLFLLLLHFFPLFLCTAAAKAISRCAISREKKLFRMCARIIKRTNGELKEKVRESLFQVRVQHTSFEARQEWLWKATWIEHNGTRQNDLFYYSSIETFAPNKYLNACFKNVGEDIGPRYLHSKVDFFLE